MKSSQKITVIVQLSEDDKHYILLQTRRFSSGILSSRRQMSFSFVLRQANWGNTFSSIKCIIHLFGSIILFSLMFVLNAFLYNSKIFEEYFRVCDNYIIVMETRSFNSWEVFHSVFCQENSFNNFVNNSLIFTATHQPIELPPRLVFQ